MIYSTIRYAELDLEAYRGDKSVYAISLFEDEDNTIPFDLSIYAGTLKMQVKRGTDDTRALVTLDETSGLSIGGADNNELTITNQGITNVIKQGEYLYDVEGVDTFGDRLTFLGGKYIHVADVTR